MSIHEQISHVYDLLRDGRAAAAAGEMELLRIVPIASFGQGLLPRLLFAAERQSVGGQVEILRTFLDRLTAEFTDEEAQALAASEQGDADPAPFFCTTRRLL